VIAKSESGSGDVDIYTVIYDGPKQARKFRAERRYIQPTNCDAGIKIQMT
jgi:hypothetical protein